MKMVPSCSPLILLLITISIVIISTSSSCTTFLEKNYEFSIKEATLQEIQTAFKQNKLTSRKLVEFYISEIQRLNGHLRSVIEVNPDALLLADEADKVRSERSTRGSSSVSLLHGVPILLKDNIATKDKLNTTAGSYALLGSVVPRDAGVVEKLREVGVIILGKASMTEWAAYRSNGLPNGWNARGGQTVNPYVASANPCGSSTGSAVSVAANLAAVSLGTETAGSILCPSGANSAVGIKPTVGLTSRAGVVPISPRQDTVGPICRTVYDAVYILDAIVGFDQLDAATKEGSKHLPRGGYLQFLKSDGLKGKRLGISSSPVFGFGDDPDAWKTFQPHLNILRKKGAILVEGLKVSNLSAILNWSYNDQFMVMNAEFKIALNAYLKQLVSSPIRSLADAIEFNKKNSKLEKTNEYRQDVFLEAEKTNGLDKVVKKGLANLTKACNEGFEKLMKKHKLDALVTVSDYFYPVLGIGGYPGISVPAGYAKDGRPFGITFSGLKFTEPRLIEIAYGFEQGTHFRKPPSL
ncbi:hydrolase [Lithospermum erythrorhizon]|uniref:Hydrolase n=1 Tax=Lithospermum erythrorhizon TaxID=34254 RepID=A0AAV3R3Q2_LITER